MDWFLYDKDLRHEKVKLNNAELFSNVWTHFSPKSKMKSWKGNLLLIGEKGMLTKLPVSFMILSIKEIFDILKLAQIALVYGQRITTKKTRQAT